MDMGDDLLGITMHMSIKWQWDISFIFQSWTAHSDQVGFIIIGLVISAIVSMLSVTLPTLKAKITAKLFRKEYSPTLLLKDRDSILSQMQSVGEKIFVFFYIFAYSILHIATMMLIMTYNGYVIIAVIFGLVVGFSIFGMECDKDKEVPVNCCA